MASGDASEPDQRLEAFWDHFWNATEHLYEEFDRKGDIFVIKIHEKIFRQHTYNGKDNQGKSVISPALDLYKFCREIRRNWIKGVLEEVIDERGQLRWKYYVIGRFNHNIGWRDFDRNLHKANQNEDSSYGMVLYEIAYDSTDWKIISIQAKDTPFKRLAKNTPTTFVTNNDEEKIIDINSVLTYKNNAA